jgi:hypothetical protein
VHKPNGTTRVFQESSHGLYYMDTQATCITLVNTVQGDKSDFTNCNSSHGVLARNIQKMIGRPSNHTFLKIIENKLLPNCHITCRDISIVDAIFGPAVVGPLKGKTVCHGATCVETTLTNIPATIMTIIKTWS